MKSPIYAPAGKAGEYSEWAINLQLTCPHCCYYCSAPATLHKSKDDYFNYRGYRPGIVEETRKQLEKEQITGRLIHIPFVGDAYPLNHDSTITREIISLLKEHGNHVQLLTKNGADAVRDFDLLDGDDWFGVTYAGYSLRDIMHAPEAEPKAGPPALRLKALELAHSLGIRTWVSCEPVLNTDSIYDLIVSGWYIDQFKIGKLNYFPSDINWAEFGRKAEALCRAHGRNYMIKEGLRKEMSR